MLQGRLTLVRYNNEPQFFVADAAVFLGLVADIMERLGPYLESDGVDAETLSRLRDAVALDRAQDRRAPSAELAGRGRPMRQLYLAATGQNRGKTTVSSGCSTAACRRGLPHRLHEARRPADRHRRRRAGRRGRRPDARGLRPPRAVLGDEPGPHPARLHQGVHRRATSSRTSARGSAPRTPRSPGPRRPADRGHGPRRASGAVIGLSNARVAAMLGAPAIIVSARAASAGRSTRSCSTRRCSRATASRSRARSSTRCDARRAAGHRARPCERGLAPHGIPLLGALPYRPILSNPTLGMILEGVARRDDLRRARTSTGSSTTSRSARWSRGTCSSGSGRDAW